MSWISLPNEPIIDFRGRPVQAAKLDDNLETIYHPIRCPGEDCDEQFTNLQAFQDHVFAHDEDLSGASTQAREVRVDLDTAHLIFQVLSVLRNAAPDSPLAKVRKANDSMHAERTWARAWAARDEKAPVALHTTQYEWLHCLLDRTLPLSKDDKANGAEVQTLAQVLFGLSWYQYRQALTIVSEREKDEEELAPPAPAGVSPQEQVSLRRRSIHDDG